MKGFGAGWHTRRVGISRIFAENLWPIPRGSEHNRLTLSPCRIAMIEERNRRDTFFLFNQPLRHFVIIKEREKERERERDLYVIT